MYPFLRPLGIAKITTTTHLRKEKNERQSHYFVRFLHT